MGCAKCSLPRTRVAISGSGDWLTFDVEMEYEVVNPTAYTVPFQPRLEFEKGEHPTLRSVTCFGEPDYGSGATLEAKKTDPTGTGVLHSAFPVSNNRAGAHC
jgi:hypothetical protein